MTDTTTDTTKTETTEPLAIHVLRNWRDLVWGCADHKGHEYTLWDGDDCYMIATGTGDCDGGGYAYKIADVAAWVEAATAADESEELGPEGTWYQHFCDRVDACDEIDLALLVWKEEEICLFLGGDSIIEEVDLPAACVEEAEVIRLLSDELECDAADLTVTIDDTAQPAPGGQSRVEWYVTIDCDTDLDETDTIEIVTQYGDVSVSVSA